jgi:hypothetical protein
LERGCPDFPESEEMSGHPDPRHQVNSTIHKQCDQGSNSFKTISQVIFLTLREIAVPKATMIVTAGTSKRPREKFHLFGDANGDSGF